ncbi:MAG: hypothetical protein ACRCT8_08930 [Lacipirellulaceae bacterium]
MIATPLPTRNTSRPSLAPGASASGPALAGPAPGTHRVVCAWGEEIAPATLERLERLDDAVFAALRGDAAALDEAVYQWRDAVTRIDPRLLEASREVYHERAASHWCASRERPDASLPQAFAALEILALVAQ